MSKLLNRESFLKRFAFRDVDLADGATVRIRALPASYLVDGAEDRFSAASLLINSLCDENGVLMFAQSEGNEAMTVDSTALRTILDAVIDLNGLRPGGNDAEKNFEAGAADVPHDIPLTPSRLN